MIKEGNAIEHTTCSQVKQDNQDLNRYIESSESQTQTRRTQEQLERYRQEGMATQRQEDSKVKLPEVVVVHISL